jgi:hypothetical protein
MTEASRRLSDETDLVLLELVRLVSRDNWNAADAADRLLAKRHSVGALWRARAGVLRAQLGQSEKGSVSTVAARAADTLHAALTKVAENRETTQTLVRAVERCGGHRGPRYLTA